MGTQDNLKAAFAGESQANRKYLAYADKARKEGFENTAKLFEAIAEAETIHAIKQFEIMGGVNSTLENLNDAFAGEEYEYTDMYPGFIEEAEKEGAKDARRIFHLANEAEKAHGKLFSKAAESLKGGTDFEAESFALCPVCGYVAENEAPERCPICGAPAKNFRTFK